jgi:ABC-type spermidine/putrescine transport system permease subunit II
MKNLIFFSLCALLFISPLLVLTVYSFAPGWKFPQLIPEHLSARAFVFIYQQWTAIGKSIFISVLYSLASVLLTLIMCYFPAAVLAQKEFKGKKLVEGFLITPALVPPMSFALGLHYMLIKLGLADTFTGVVLILSIFSYPYMLRALMAGFQVLGNRYSLCAQNLGAGFWRTLFRVELPLLLPALVAGGSVVFLVAFSEYFLVFLIGGGAVPSFTGYLFPLLTSSDRSLASLLSLGFLLVPLLLFLFLEMTITRIYRKKGMN